MQSTDLITSWNCVCFCANFQAEMQSDARSHRTPATRSSLFCSSGAQICFHDLHSFRFQYNKIIVYWSTAKMQTIHALKLQGKIVKIFRFPLTAPLRSLHFPGRSAPFFHPLTRVLSHWTLHGGDWKCEKWNFGTIKNASRENTRHENTGNEKARHENTRHENAGNENSGKVWFWFRWALTVCLAALKFKSSRCR